MPPRRVSKAKWLSMTPTQRKSLSRSLGSKYPSKSTRTRGEFQPNKPSGSIINPVMISRPLPLFGLRTRRMLPYYESIAVTGSVSAVYAYAFSANGLFDPNITGTGHQPMGFDQMMVFYNHYTVLSANIRVTFHNTGTETVYVGAEISGSTTYSTDLTVHMENGEIVFAPLNPAHTAGCFATLRNSVDNGKYQGMSQSQILADPDMRGDSASNPTEQTYFILPIWNPVTAAAPTVVIDVLIQYDVIFHEPRKGTLS